MFKISQTNDTIPLRRSARTRTLPAKLNAFMMVTLCVIVMMVPISTVVQEINTANLISHKSNTIKNTTGLTYFFNRDVLIQIGRHHVDIDTNLKPKTDIEKMKRHVEEYLTSCDKAAKRFSPIYCREQTYELARKRNQAVKTIEWDTKEKIKRRTKRSFHQGVIPRILACAIGS